MKKDYNQWCKIKTRKNAADASGIYFREREIWWCSIGLNVGQEQDGKGDEFSRPVLIFKKFNRQLCWVIPLSTEIKRGNFFFPLLAESNVFRTATLPQMRMIDAKRLIKLIDVISFQEYTFITEKVIAFMQ